VAGSNPVPTLRKVSDDGKGPIELYADPTPVPRERSPVDDLAKQIGGSNQPAQGGRSLAMVKSKTALGQPSSLDAGSMELDYVRRGQRDVERCFDALRAKDPAAKGEITLRFTVDTKGAVVDPEVTGFNAELSPCIQASMQQWKFTAPNKPSRFELILKLVVG
jgi:hypothetical protein